MNKSYGVFFLLSIFLVCWMVTKDFFGLIQFAAPWLPATVGYESQQCLSMVWGGRN